MQSSKHFPVVAVAYGYLAVIKTTLRNDYSLTEMPEVLVDASNEINLRIVPENTYIFDGINQEEADEILDDIEFYHELSHGVVLHTFMKEKVLSRVFTPIATYHQDLVN